ACFRCRQVELVKNRRAKVIRCSHLGTLKSGVKRLTVHVYKWARRIHGSIQKMYTTLSGQIFVAGVRTCHEFDGAAKRTPTNTDTVDLRFVTPRGIEGPNHDASLRGCRRISSKGGLCCKIGRSPR